MKGAEVEKYHIPFKELPFGNTEQAKVFTEQKGAASPVAASGSNPTSMQ